MQDRIRVLRIIEYEGPRDLVERTIKRSIHGEKIVSTRNGEEEFIIRAASIGVFPQILRPANTNDGTFNQEAIKRAEHIINVYGRDSIEGKIANEILVCFILGG